MVIFIMEFKFAYCRWTHEKDHFMSQRKQLSDSSICLPVSDIATLNKHIDAIILVRLVDKL